MDVGVKEKSSWLISDLNNKLVVPFTKIGNIGELCFERW